jgi:hypothetical protein
MHDCARRASRAQNDGAPRAPAPTGGLIVKIGEKAGDVGIVSTKLAILKP